MDENKTKISATLTSIKMLKTIGWGMLFILATAYIFRNAIPYFSLDPEHFGRHWSHSGLLLTHISFGIIALFLGPFQFWSGLRNKYISLHRWIGRIYLVSIGISAIVAIYLLTIPERNLGFHVGVTGMAVAWLVTGSFAYISIVRKQISLHKEWVIRSYAVTFGGFMFFRILGQWMYAMDFASGDVMSSIVSWTSWAVPLLITEWVIQIRKIFHT